MPCTTRTIRPHADHEGARSRRFTAAMLSAIALGLAFAACRETPAGPPPEDDSASIKDAHHVGGDTCSECHAEQTELWRGSHHDLAMQPATPATVLGDFDGASFTYGDVISTFFRKDTSSPEFWVRTDGADGSLAEFEISYTFGVEPLQQYLVEMEDGRVQALSICWDTRPAAEGGQRWFHLYPDELITAGDPLHWTGIYQNWNFMCADCHSTNVDKGYDLAADTYATTWSEIDVACEACHGPGSQHVAWAQAGSERSSLGDTLGLVASLRDRSFGRWAIGAGSPNAVLTLQAPRPEIEACARCHARRTPLHGTVQHGRPFLDTYRPALLEAPLYHADGQILDEVYVYGSFTHSKMFQQGVSCNDCHEPHSLELRGTTETVCAQCHQRTTYFTRSHHQHPEGSEGARCVACHMPSRTYMGVDSRRDHSFRVPRPDLSLEVRTPNACNACHLDRSTEWALQAVEQWYPQGRSGSEHFAHALHAARENRADAESLLSAVASDHEAPAIVRGTALRELAAFVSPNSFSAVREAMSDPAPLVRLGAPSALERVDPEAQLVLLPLLDDPVRAVRVEAARVLSAIPPAALTPAQLQRIDAALGEYREAQMTVIDRPEAHLNLGTLAAQRGDVAAARAAFHQALALAPGYAAARLNLADLARQEGQEEEAIRELTQALQEAPDDPRVHHALGLSLVRAGRRQEALSALARAAELAPGEPRYAYVHGIALHDLGDPVAALSVLASAHDRNPAHRETLVALINYSRASNHTEEALVYARRLLELAPQDAAVERLVRQLESDAGP